MLNYFYDSKHFLYFFGTLFGFLSIVFLLVSCSGRPKQEGQYQRINPLNDTSQKMDAQFLVDAVEINMMEMQLGVLAQKKASSTNVSDLGKKLEVEHAAYCKQVVTLAKQKLIPLPLIPSKKAQTAYEKLNEKSNTRFDKAYCNMMVDEHKDALALFEKVSTNASDPEIKAWALSMLPVMKSHLELAQKCQ